MKRSHRVTIFYTLALLVCGTIPVDVIRLMIDPNDDFLDSEFSAPYIGLTVSF